MMADVVGLLLAAGRGRRAGGPKALRVDASGLSWVCRSIDVLRSGGCTDVLVVTGAAADRVARLVEERGESSVHCTTWSEGMGASLRTGLIAAAQKGHDAVLIHLVDLPDVTSDVVARLLDGAGESSLTRASYAAGPGHPVLVGRRHFAALAATLHGDVGGRAYLRQHVVRLVDCSDLATGIDTDDPA
jgi:CTP:molybdopterin cytidylyltransferase MocA